MRNIIDRPDPLARGLGYGVLLLTWAIVVAVMLAFVVGWATPPDPSTLRRFAVGVQGGGELIVVADECHIAQTVGRVSNFSNSDLVCTQSNREVFRGWATYVRPMGAGE